MSVEFCTSPFFGFFVAVRLRSFNDVPFLLDRKLQHFDRKQRRELARCEAVWRDLAQIGLNPSSKQPQKKRGRRRELAGDGQTGFRWRRLERDLPCVSKKRSHGTCGRILLEKVSTGEAGKPSSFGRNLQGQQYYIGFTTFNP
ncbi:hypothetical protein IEQ34_001397 [Dendrobium chrysotoxum]|uniref:Uncharacterized protein n=1 Tax=Dendrobium chrysotoxum TaxID=161865 RepID=A0AAV7HNK5_DENCH|nr:hypothetical protein IEQ34_001397 [Dendrobium chrysotoxum]